MIEHYLHMVNHGFISFLSYQATPRHLKFMDDGTRCIDSSPSTSSGFEMIALESMKSINPINPNTMPHLFRQILALMTTSKHLRIIDSLLTVRLLLVLFGISFFVSCDNENDMGIEEPRTSIVGAWERIETEQISKDTTVVSAPYKSIYLFTDNYYSMAVAPRERASLPASRTSEDIAAAEAGYISNSGTYKIVGDSIYFNVLVSKFPNFMNNKARGVQQIDLDEDSFILTNQNGINTTKTLFKRHK